MLKSKDALKGKVKDFLSQAVKDKVISRFTLRGKAEDTRATIYFVDGKVYLTNPVEIFGWVDRLRDRLRERQSGK
jgi:hypothetical protein